MILEMYRQFLQRTKLILRVILQAGLAQHVTFLILCEWGQYKLGLRRNDKICDKILTKSYAGKLHRNEFVRQLVHWNELVFLFLALVLQPVNRQNPTLTAYYHGFN